MTEIINKDDSLADYNSNISDKLLNEVLDPTLDLSVDYSEIFLDDLIQNEAIKEIPIVKSVVGIIKGGISISQFWFVNKLLSFIQEFNLGKIETSKLESFREKLNDNPKLGKRIAEKLMISIDRNVEIKQTQIISNLFKAYTNQDITFEDFNSILITLDRLNPKSFKAFFELEKIDFSITEKNHHDIGQRNFEMENLITASGFAWEPSSWFSGFSLTSDGTKLFEYGIKPLKRHYS